MRASNIKILIVDDEPDLLEVLSSTFGVFGFQTFTSSSGNQAIDFLKSNEVDIVLSDIRMPDGSGIDLLQFIKSRDVFTPKILFLSGYSDYSLEEMLDFGVDGFFSKPFSATRVRDEVLKALLPEAEKWGAPSAEISSEEVIEVQFESLEAAIKNQKLKLGRGGLSLLIPSCFLKEGAKISFVINFLNQEESFNLSGRGEVLWKNDVSDECLAVGVKIESLDEQSLNFYVNFISKEKMIPFIPK